MKLTKQEVEHIADLARLDLSDKEIKIYGGQLSGVLDYIDQLAEVDTDDTEPTAQVTGLQNVLREDEVKPWDEIEKQKAFKEAPDFKDSQYKVKRVLE